MRMLICALLALPLAGCGTLNPAVFNMGGSSAQFENLEPVAMDDGTVAYSETRYKWKAAAGAGDIVAAIGNMNSEWKEGEGKFGVGTEANADNSGRVEAIANTNAAIAGTAQAIAPLLMQALMLDVQAGNAASTPILNAILAVLGGVP